MTEIGIPYARNVETTDGRWGVKCPECGLVCVYEGGLSADSYEDEMTKGPARVYALHYAREHG